MPVKTENIPIAPFMGGGFGSIVQNLKDRKWSKWRPDITSDNSLEQSGECVTICDTGEVERTPVSLVSELKHIYIINHNLN